MWKREAEGRIRNGNMRLSPEGNQSSATLKLPFGILISSLRNKTQNLALIPLTLPSFPAQEIQAEKPALGWKS